MAEFITKLFSEGYRKFTITLLVLLLIFLAFLLGKIDQQIFKDMIDFTLVTFGASNVFSKFAPQSNG